MSSYSDPADGLMFGAISAALLCTAFVGVHAVKDGINAQSNSRVVVGTVQRKGTIFVPATERPDEKDFIVTDKEKLINVDSSVNWKFGSSKLQEQLIVGKRYAFKVIGTSDYSSGTYPNILSATEIFDKASKSIMPAKIAPNLIPRQ